MRYPQIQLALCFVLFIQYMIGDDVNEDNSHFAVGSAESSEEATGSALKSPSSSSIKPFSPEDDYGQDYWSTSDHLPAGEAFPVSPNINNFRVDSNTRVKSNGADLLASALSFAGLLVEGKPYHEVFSTYEKLDHQAPFIQRNATNHSLGEKVYQSAMEIMDKLPNQYAKDLYEKGVQLLESAAEKYLFPPAMETLGDMYLFGNYTNVSDWQKAQYYYEKWTSVEPAGKGHFFLAWLEENEFIRAHDKSHPRILLQLLAAAEDNFPLAKLALGFKHMYGLNVDKDLDKAVAFYYSLAEEMVKLPEYHIFPGRQYPKFNLNDDFEPPLITSSRPPIITPENLQYFELTGKSDTDQLVMLGQMYYFGSHSLPQDYGKAKAYYEEAAESGNNSAIGLLGLMYLFGHGIEGGSNYETANSLFKQCLETDLNLNPVCLTGSGIMNLYGLGVKQKIDKGLLELAQAMLMGSVEATYQLAKYNRSIKISFLGLDKIIGVQFMDQAIRQGHVQAIFEAAKNLYKGSTSLSTDVAKSLKKLAEKGHGYLLHNGWSLYKGGRTYQSMIQYMIASFCGLRIAQENVAFLMEKFGAPERAVMYWNRAAIQQSPRARIMLGDIYYYGLPAAHIAPDYYLAAQNYQLVETPNRSARAAFNLGYMHEFGLGVQQDYHLAKRYYDRIFEYEPKAYLPATAAALKASLKIFWFSSWTDHLLSSIKDVKASVYSYLPSNPFAPSTTPVKPKVLAPRKLRLSWSAYFRTVLSSYKWAWSYFQTFIVYLFVFLSFLFYARALFHLIRPQRGNVNIMNGQPGPQGQPIQQPVQQAAQPMAPIQPQNLPDIIHERRGGFNNTLTGSTGSTNQNTLPTFNSGEEKLTDAQLAARLRKPLSAAYQSYIDQQSKKKEDRPSSLEEQSKLEKLDEQAQNKEPSGKGSAKNHED